MLALLGDLCAAHHKSQHVHLGEHLNLQSVNTKLFEIPDRFWPELLGFGISDDAVSFQNRCSLQINFDDYILQVVKNLASHGP